MEQTVRISRTQQMDLNIHIEKAIEYIAGITSTKASYAAMKGCTEARTIIRVISKRNTGMCGTMSEEELNGLNQSMTAARAAIEKHMKTIGTEYAIGRIRTARCIIAEIKDQKSADDKQRNNG